MGLDPVRLQVNSDVCRMQKIVREVLLDQVPLIAFDCPDTIRALAQNPETNPLEAERARPLSSLDRAYVMYTSGSAGQPKGVEVTHLAIVRLLFSAGYAQLGAQQTILQLSSVSFDASTFEIWGALLHGGRCVLYAGDVPATRLDL